MMRKPPEKPTSLRPQGIKITLPKPILIIDSMEQKLYTFKPFRKWFAAIGRRKLPAGDYSIAGMEDKLAVVAIVIAKGGQETVKLVKEAGGEAIFVPVDCGKVADMRKLIDTTMQSK